MALTKSSTERVDMPWMLSIRVAAQPWITMALDFPAIPRGSRKDGEYLPRRSLEIWSSTAPARVSQSRQGIRCDG